MTYWWIGQIWNLLKVQGKKEFSILKMIDQYAI